MFIITRSICHGRTRLNPLPVIIGISTGRYSYRSTDPSQCGFQPCGPTYLHLYRLLLITASASSARLDRVMQWKIQYVKVLFFGSGRGGGETSTFANIYSSGICYGVGFRTAINQIGGISQSVTLSFNPLSGAGLS